MPFIHKPNNRNVPADILRIDEVIWKCSNCGKFIAFNDVHNDDLGLCPKCLAKI